MLKKDLVTNINMVIEAIKNTGNADVLRRQIIDSNREFKHNIDFINTEKHVWFSFKGNELYNIELDKKAKKCELIPVYAELKKFAKYYKIKHKVVWCKETMVELLDSNDKAVLRAILAIYNLQTAEEKCAGVTISNNGVGFNGADVEIMTSFAEGILKYGRLTTKQLKVGRRIIKKYTRQLIEIANNNN